MSLTMILVAITGIISFQAFSNRSMKEKLIFHPATVNEFGEYHRFLTSGFIHGDMNHLLINMFVLWQFGEVIESVFISQFGDLPGRMTFLFLYLGAIIVGSIPSFLKHKNNQYYAALGASGGTSAIVFAYILFDPWQWFLFPPLPAALLAIAYLAYSSYMGKRGGDNIGHDAHFWGAVFGFVVTLIAITIFRPELFDVIITRFMAGPTMPSFLGG